MGPARRLARVPSVRDGTTMMNRLRRMLTGPPRDSDVVVRLVPVQDDPSLFAAWRDGDRSAGEVLVDRHYDSIARFFRTKVGAHSDDLVQRVFLVCVDRGANFRGDASFRAFLFGIARNVLYEFYRAKSKDGRNDPDFGASSIMDLAPGISTMAIQRAEQRLLIQALQRLPVDLQMAVELYYWEELSIGELAQVLEVPPGTVKSRLFRAREALRELMDSIPGTPDEHESLRSVLQLYDQTRPLE
jgi:RNA polymerase sigma factor (sigma-70 family)